MNEPIHTDHQQNPLMPFTRQPIVFVKLPSNGNFVSDENYETSVNGEIGVSAMTASDELLLKTPDALLNGESIAKMIQSCAPGIKNVYELSNPDIDALLLAIRMASYGDEMEFAVTCPECERENIFAASLDACLTNMTFLEAEYVEKLSNDVTVSLRPYTFKSNMKNSLLAFQEGQIIKAMMDNDPDEEAVQKIYNENIVKMSSLLVELTADCILKIWDPEGTEIPASREQIIEWVKQIPKKDAEKLQEKVASINNSGIGKKMFVTCINEECGHSWETEINFDPAYFFE